MKNLKRKNLVLALLVLLALAVTGTSYAYWASSVVKDTEIKANTVSVGTGEAITISITPTNNTTETRKLVPVGFGEQTNETTYAGDTESYVINYSVIWNDDTALDGQPDSTISATVGAITVGGVANPSGLIIVTPAASNPTTIALGATVNFTFTVTMTEPADKAEYDAVAGKDITFNVTFEVTPAE